MTTTTYEHTIPSGDTITFSVRVDEYGDLVVSYDAVHNLSKYAARDAYPTAAIEADYGTFKRCIAHGEHKGVAWELWEVR